MRGLRSWAVFHVFPDEPDDGYAAIGHYHVGVRESEGTPFEIPAGPGSLSSLELSPAGRGDWEASDVGQRPDQVPTRLTRGTTVAPPIEAPSRQGNPPQAEASRIPGPSAEPTGEVQAPLSRVATAGSTPAGCGCPNAGVGRHLLSCLRVQAALAKRQWASKTPAQRAEHKARCGDGRRRSRGTSS